MKIKSLAKINLGLEVLAKREDGYHDIKTLFQSIDFYDVIQFQPLSSGKIVLEGDRESIPWDQENLIHKAASYLKKAGGISHGVKIKVEKNIPPGSGLGGGSSNAAVSLMALNTLWDLGLKKNELQMMGRKIGADVSFFMGGGLCLGEGRGDMITPQEDLPDMCCLLILPPRPLPTEHVYQSHRLSLTSQNKDSKIIKFLEHRDIRILENDLEETAFRFYPHLEDIKRYLLSCRALLSLMSGSGSAVFGIFQDRKSAEAALSSYEHDDTLHLVDIVRREKYWDCLGTGV